MQMPHMYRREKIARFQFIHNPFRGHIAGLKGAESGQQAVCLTPLIYFMGFFKSCQGGCKYSLQGNETLSEL